MEEDEEDDPIGYGHPPKDTRWKKNGPSPNPGGRGKRNIRQQLTGAFEKALAQSVRCKTADGRTRRMRADEALIEVLMQKVAQGNQRAARLMQALSKRTGVLAPPPPLDKRVGVLVVGPYMTEQEWYAKFGGQRMSTNPLDGLPGIDAEAFERALAEKRRMQEEGYREPKEEDDRVETPSPAPASRRGRTADDP